jgi:RNA polymerase sigma-70 factor, ECF subfamily
MQAEAMPVEVLPSVPGPAAPGATGPEEAIGAAIRAGDLRTAVALCARQHGAAIGRLAMAMLGSQPDAEEVVQETLLAAHRGMAAWRGDGTVRSWLFAIARRQCAQHLERGRRTLQLHGLPEESAPAGDDPAGAMATRRRAARVRAALTQLKPTEREALLLRYEADLSYREIGAMCGVDEAAARKRASRGLDRMRSLIARDGREGNE